ncbi:MAG: hypothetical protein LWX11_07795 [Firmicutes bacterium]|nr:hypothetical protein [Bacillota bacterium]
MTTFIYNDLHFKLEARDGSWDLGIERSGTTAYAGVGLFPGASSAEAETKAKALARTIFPVGVKCVGPDVAHPNTIGDLKIVGPDVAHPNFIYWNKDSVSCPRER